jgi:hypothetical protein
VEERFQVFNRFYTIHLSKARKASQTFVVQEECHDQGVGIEEERVVHAR